MEDIVLEIEAPVGRDEEVVTGCFELPASVVYFADGDVHADVSLGFDLPGDTPTSTGDVPQWGASAAAAAAPTAHSAPGASERAQQAVLMHYLRASRDGDAPTATLSVDGERASGTLWNPRFSVHGGTDDAPDCTLRFLSRGEV